MRGPRYTSDVSTTTTLAVSGTGARTPSVSTHLCVNGLSMLVKVLPPSTHTTPCGLTLTLNRLVNHSRVPPVGDSTLDVLLFLPALLTRSSPSCKDFTQEKDL